METVVKAMRPFWAELETRYLDPPQPPAYLQALMDELDGLKQRRSETQRRIEQLEDELLEKGYMP